jgi:alkanesulfonate monooxygenase SsuD/methylene tetrahydromethanopterin reductase-like flavin-dependent oxidoreductase (luciferase family)
MRVGIGLPNAVPGTDGPLLLEWARRAESASFTSLGVLDRMAYDSYEPLGVLAAAAGATSTIDLVTMVVVAPLRNTRLLAKEVATIDRISGGRLVLGLAVGARSEDYDAVGVEHAGRGRVFDEQLAELRRIWGDEALSPVPAKELGPTLLVGGSTDQTFSRAAASADGYVHGGGPPRAFARAAEKMRVAWHEAGRAGEPALWAQGYFALGDAAEEGLDYMRDYYAFTGPFAEKIAAGLLTTPQDVAQFVRGYEHAGCHELVLLPAVADLDQVEALAEVL